MNKKNQCYFLKELLKSMMNGASEHLSQVPKTNLFIRDDYRQVS